MTLTTNPVFLAITGAVSFRTGFGSDVLQMLAHTGPVVKAVLVILLLFSVLSWAIIFMKWRLFRKAKQETAYFLDLFWGSSALNQIYTESEDMVWSPVAHLFRAGYAELKRTMKIQSPSNPGEWDPAMVQPVLENVGRALRRATIDQSNRMERFLSFLATTGNTAPFIGLFGTVWGIMESFRGIGMRGSASLAVVAPGISEALIATAAGLAAAIPAVVAFNYFNQGAMTLRSEMDNFASDFLSLVERQFIKRRMVTKESM
ncbi:MAG: protein TolQ [Deltaproteobacteria bacterium]|nr:protein TolQ [Deltaproteobacteria bacterium]